MILAACSKDDGSADIGPTAYQLAIPAGLPAMPIPPNNPLTVEGVALGRKLFYDPILSGDNSMACADCHLQKDAFTDVRQFSRGINGDEGKRNAMPLFNLGCKKNSSGTGVPTVLNNRRCGPSKTP